MCRFFYDWILAYISIFSPRKWGSLWNSRSIAILVRASHSRTCSRKEVKPLQSFASKATASTPMRCAIYKARSLCQCCDITIKNFATFAELFTKPFYSLFHPLPQDHYPACLKEHD